MLASLEGDVLRSSFFLTNVSSSGTGRQIFRWHSGSVCFFLLPVKINILCDSHDVVEESLFLEFQLFHNSANDRLFLSLESLHDYPGMVTFKWIALAVDTLEFHSDTNIV